MTSYSFSLRTFRASPVHAVRLHVYRADVLYRVPWLSMRNCIWPAEASGNRASRARRPYANFVGPSDCPCAMHCGRFTGCNKQHRDWCRCTRECIRNERTDRESEEPSRERGRWEVEIPHCHIYMYLYIYIYIYIERKDETADVCW